jgi:GH15 family glucan-1,4-alpha-glucosidase
MDLWEKSVSVIRENQSPNGAFIASPAFPTYNYSWFRDGSYIAYAMDLAGDHDSAHRFFNWALWAVDQRSEKAERAIAAGKAGKAPDDADLLDTRYTVDGQPGEMEWLNNQLDGFGTLLWAIEQHLKITGTALPENWQAGVSLLARYLEALWKQPCSDCWEEFADKIHIATLSVIYGGLNAASRMLHERIYRDEATRIKTFVLYRGVKDGHLVKFIGTDWVDASLIHASTPYRLLEPDDPIMQATVAKLESDLIFHGGGLHRYVEDNYYGGGEWLLLTAYLAWHNVERGEFARAEELRAWIEAQADELGNMPEQVPGHLLIPEMLPIWEAKWGPVASPLVWSHAAYLTLVDAMTKAL